MKKKEKLYTKPAHPGTYFLFVGDDDTEIHFYERWIIPELSGCRTRIVRFEVHPAELPHLEIEIKNGFEYTTTRNTFSLLEEGPGYRLSPARPRGADWELFDSYPDAISMSARDFPGSKIGGSWGFRGELPEPGDEDEASANQVWLESKQAAFLGQLNTIRLAQRQPFINVKQRNELGEEAEETFFKVGDVGSIKFFYDGQEIEHDCDSH